MQNHPPFYYVAFQGAEFITFEDFFLSGCCVQSDDSESENNQRTLLLHIRKGVVAGLG